MSVSTAAAGCCHRIEGGVVGRWAVAVAVMSSLACGAAPGVEDLGTVGSMVELAGGLSHPDEVVVVPDRFWETDAAATRWEFRGYANLVCEVGSTPIDDLEFILEPDDSSRASHYMVKWDGERLWPEPRRFTESGAVVTIPRGRATPGRHRLNVRRVASADEPGQRERVDNTFSTVGFAAGGALTRLDPAAADRFEMIRAFLEDGVIGAGLRKHGGRLVIGSNRSRVRLSLAEEVTAVFDVVSLTGSRARFSVEVAGTVSSAAVSENPVSLSVPLPAGEVRIDLAVDGSRDGLHLWGAPRLSLPRTVSPVPPVVLLTLDTTRADALSVYGGPAAASPRLAEFATQASVFDNAWAVSPWTLPSHASIFTGLYPSRHGAGVGEPRLTEGVPTLAEAYRRAGYRTAGFAGGEMTASHWGVAQGFETYVDPDGFETRGDRLTDLAEEFVSSVAGEPFFLFVNYFDPHADYEAPAEQQRLFAVDEHRKRLPEGSLWADLARGRKGVWRTIVHEEVEVPDGAVEWLRAAYLAEVAFMDRQIGRLLDRLQEVGELDRAIVVVVADHGEFLGEHGFFSHGCRLEPELTHIPLIIKQSGQRRPERFDALVSHVDLAPTLLAQSGLQPFAGDGIDLLRGDPSRSAVLMEEHENRIHPLIEKIMVARHLFGWQQQISRQIFWKGGSECFVRSAGGWAASSCEVGWRQRMEQLDSVVKRPSRPAEDGPPVPLGDEMRKRLEALGYVH